MDQHLTLPGGNIANPMGMLMSAAMLMEWLSGQHDDKLLFKVSCSIEAAVNKALSEGESTKDLGGNLGTKEFTGAIIDRL